MKILISRETHQMLEEEAILPFKSDARPVGRMLEIELADDVFEELDRYMRDYETYDEAIQRLIMTARAGKDVSVN